MGSEMCIRDSTDAIALTLGMIGDHLFDLQADGSITLGGICESYEQIDDVTVKFVLKEGVKFSDGTDLTSEDILWELSRLKEAPRSASNFAFVNAEESEIVDDRTIIVKFNQAWAPYQNTLSTGRGTIVSKAAFEAMGEADFSRAPVTTGPYKVAEWIPGTSITLTRNEYYWGEPAKTENIVIKFIPEATSRVIELETGAADIAYYIEGNDVARVDALDGYHVESGDAYRYLVVTFSMQDAILKDARVRQALCYAANRQEVLDMIADGKGTIIGSSMFPAFGKYYVPELSERYNQDIEKAKELLKEAGYPDGFELTITVPNNYQQHIDTAQVLVEQLKAIGVTAKIQQVEWDSWLSDVYADRKFQSTVVGVDAAYLSGRALLERFTSTSSKNFINYSNEEYDKLYQQVKTSTDEEEQVELYKKMETLLCDDAANLYIEDMACEVALRSDFAGYQFYPLYVQDMAKIYKVK